MLSSQAIAQKAPELGYVYPPGGRIGTTVDVKLGGYDFTPDMQFFVHDPRVKLMVLGPPGKFFVPEPPYWFGPKGRTAALPIPREIPARIEIPSDMPPGPVFWQVANANGSSDTAVFIIGNQSEVVEDRRRNEPQQIKELPVTISGRLRKIAEVDRYRFTAKKTGQVSVELMARRLGSNFHGTLTVCNSSGRVIADVADTEGIDVFLTFAVTAGRQYEIHLHDVDFRGNRAFVYRLSLTLGPRVFATVPAAARRGERRSIEFIGYGVATGAAKLESVARVVAFPNDSPHNWFVYRLQTEFGTAPAVSLIVSDFPERVESELPDRKLRVPGAVTGVLGTDASKDRYIFEAKKGETWRIRAQSQAIGTQLDLSLQILSPKGKQLTMSDDLHDTLDAEIVFVTPSDGLYTLLVADNSGRTGSSVAVYRLVVQRPTADFSLTTPQRVAVPIDGKAEFLVKAIRFGGFKDDIAVHIEGIPDGIQVADDLKIAEGTSELKVAIEAVKDAASLAAVIKTIGVATVGEQIVSHIATADAAGNLCPRSQSEKHISVTLLTTTMKAPFSIELVDQNRQRVVHCGTTYPAEFIIKRDEGFTGAVMLQMAAIQSGHRQGIRGPIISAHPGVERVLYPCFMPEWLETGRTSRMSVQAVASVNDPKGKSRYLTKDANARVTMILEGALLKIAHTADDLNIRPGDSFDVPIEVVRSAKLSEAANIKLVVPDDLSDMLSAEPLILDTDCKHGILRIATVADSRLKGEFRITVKAIVYKNGKWPVVSQTEVLIVFTANDR